MTVLSAAGSRDAGTGSPPPPRITAAPGKAMLIGEYAVLDGAPAVVAAVGCYARARLADVPPASPFISAALAHAAPTAPADAGLVLVIDDNADIRAGMRAHVEAVSDAYCMLGIPLLAEGGRNELIDRVLVVDCPEALQMERVRARDHLTEAEVAAIMRTQASREARLRIADDVVVNDGDTASLAGRVDELHNMYLQLAAAKA